MTNLAGSSIETADLDATSGTDNKILDQVSSSLPKIVTFKVNIREL